MLKTFIIKLGMMSTIIITSSIFKTAFGGVINNDDIKDGVYEIVFTKHNQALDIYRGITTESRCVAFNAFGADHSKWVLQRDQYIDGHQYYTIMNVNSKLFLTITPYLTVVQFPSNDGKDNQLFRFEQKSPGIFEIKEKRRGAGIAIGDCNDRIWDIHVDFNGNGEFKEIDKYVMLRSIGETQVVKPLLTPMTVPKQMPEQMPEQLQQILLHETQISPKHARPLREPFGTPEAVTQSSQHSIGYISVN